MSTAFASNYKHDVFVSYAHVDDIPPHGAADGWVTTFVSELRRLLAGQLGRIDNHSVWMDHRLRGNDAVSPTILTEVDNSATLLVILSHGYLKSEWCSRERCTFLNKVKTLRRGGTPVFVIEKQSLHRDRWPSELKDLRGYQFWAWRGQPGLETPTYTLADPVPRLDEHSYYLRLNDLSFDLAAVLHQLRRPASEGRSKVFLAEVTDDLEEKRQEVKRYLDQRGLQVLPNNYYPNDPETFRRIQKNELSGCKLFVQLLSSLSGKCRPGAENGFPVLQYQIAKEKKLPIVQWRSPDLDLDAEMSDVQRKLLEAETVMAVPIAEFKAEVVKRATTPVPEPLPPPKPKIDDREELFVFINHSDEDVELAKWCGEVIRKRPELGYALPLQEGSPRKLRKQLEDNLLTSDVVLWFYGHAPRAWVHEQLQYFRKLASGRKTRPRGLAVCRCPPPENPELNVKLPSMHEIDWRSGLDEADLWRFLESLETAGAP